MRAWFAGASHRRSPRADSYDGGVILALILIISHRIGERTSCRASNGVRLLLSYDERAFRGCDGDERRPPASIITDEIRFLSPSAPSAHE